MTNKLRYEVKPRPEYKQTPGYEHMLVDNHTVKALTFGVRAELELKAFQMNDGGKVA